MIWGGKGGIINLMGGSGNRQQAMQGTKSFLGLFHTASQIIYFDAFFSFFPPLIIIFIIIKIHQI